MALYFYTVSLMNQNFKKLKKPLYFRGARADLMLGSTDSLEATSSNATRATYNYEVDTPMTGSLTSGGNNEILLPPINTN